MRIHYKKIIFLSSFIWSIIFQTQTNADELKIYVIRPNTEIDWTSPSSLGVTSALNSTGSDYAPIGHFAIELNCSRPNTYGIRHVLTGMERKNRQESQDIIRKNGLGLGSLMYSFRGNLQSASEANTEIRQARRDRRLKIIRVPTSKDRCDLMMEFMNRWIDAGSYQVYGGGKRTAEGEGAGCADFAMQFHKIATQMTLLPSWSPRVKIPNSLIGTPQRKVALAEVVLRLSWAQNHEPSTPFQIPDGDRVWGWLNENGYRCGKEYLWIRHGFGYLAQKSNDCEWIEQNILRRVEVLPTHPLVPFKFRYSTSENPKKIWEKIKL